MPAVSRTLLIAFFLTLAGCATGPQFAKDRSPGQVCISDDSTYFDHVFSPPTQGTLHFREINGNPIKAADIPVCLTPGKHKFKLYVWTDFREMAGDVELELKPDVSYWLRAKLNGSWGFGDTFEIQLLNVTDDKREVVAAFSVPATAKKVGVIYVPGGTPLVLPR